MADSSEIKTLPPALNSTQMYDRYKLTKAQLAKRRRIWQEGIQYARIPGTGTVYFWEEIDTWLRSYHTAKESKSDSTSMGFRGSPPSQLTLQKRTSRRFEDKRERQNNV